MCGPSLLFVVPAAEAVRAQGSLASISSADRYFFLSKYNFSRISKLLTIFIIIPINYIIMIHEKTLQYINKPTLVACQDSTCPVYFFWPKKEQSFLNSAISTMQFRVGKLHKYFEFSHLAPLFSAVVFPHSNDNKSGNFNFFSVVLL